MGDGSDRSKEQQELLRQLAEAFNPDELRQFLEQRARGTTLIATTGGAAATGNGIAFGSAGTVNVHVQPTLPDGEPEHSYLQRVLRETDDLPLEGVDPEAKANPNLRVRLRAIYTGLTVTGYRPEIPKKLKREALEREQSRTISALEALGRERRLVLLGQPGGGKSTFVNFVAHCLAGGLLNDAEANLATLCAPLPKEDGSDGKEPQPFSVTELLPLRIVLRDFAASGRVRGQTGDLWSYIEEKLAKVPAPPEEGELLLRRLRKGDVLVLLDGLDEVPEPQKLRRKLVDSILAFERSFPGCRYVVTSRIDPYRNQGWELPGFRVAELAPFSDGQIRAFLRRWYDHAAALRPNRFPETPAVRASWLKRAIFRTRNLRELAGRPLLLTLMAAVHAWRGKLPDDRQQLYEEMVELLLARWEDRFERGPDQKRLFGMPEVEDLAGCSQEELRHTLEALAYAAHANQENADGTADIRAGDLLTALRKVGRGGNATALVEYLKERAGILIEREPDVFTFPHRSFQEYLAACHLLDQRPEPLEELVSRDVDRWREVVLLAAAKKRGTSRAEVWDLVARFCPRSAAEAAGDRAAEWRALVAGQIVSECFLSKGDLEKLGERDEGLLGRVRAWQLALLRSGILPSLERHRAGLVLGELGDPRFDPDFYFLPAESNLGFIEIPAGRFLMGSNKDHDPLAYEDELPQHEVDLPAYWIALFPVTVQQMVAFQRDSGFELGNPDWAAGAPHTPVVIVSTTKAEAYCRWLEEKLRTQGGVGFSGKLGELVASGRFRVCLPSEEQWEKAARGEGGSIYPWQGPHDAGMYNGAEAGIRQPSVVGAFASGASVFGVEEMSGNVLEWTSSPWRASYGEPVSDAKDSDNASRVVRGGAFGSGGRYVRCASRDRLHPLFRVGSVGFRVALAPFSVP